MANTLRITAQAQFILDGETLPLTLLQAANESYTVTSNLMASGIQAIGTSAENLDFGSVTTEGYASFKNLDDTNFVQIGWDATGFQAAIKLLPRQVAIVPLEPTRTWQAKADTAGVDLQFSVIGV